MVSSLLSELAPGSASDAMRAASRLLSLATEQGARADGLRLAVIREACGLFAAAGGVLIALTEDGELAVPVAGDVAEGQTGRAREVAAGSALAVLIEPGQPPTQFSGEQAEPLAALLGVEAPCMLGLALRRHDGAADHVLLLAGHTREGLTAEQLEVATAFANAAAAALAQSRVVEEHVRQVARQSALTRAAKTLHESLELETLLTRICEEAAAVLDGDVAIAYRGSEQDGLHIAAAAGCPPEMLGFRLEPGSGLAGRALAAGRPVLTNHYQATEHPSPASPFERFEAALAMPFHWGDELHGVLSVGYSRPHRVAEEDLTLLEAFGELAAVACRNASLNAGLVLAARTDGLTGCLNHAALHDGLRREFERAARDPGARLSLVLFDLDYFKQINEAHGHLVGDEVLRRVGTALRGATRPYDLAARYGGDEFALITAGAGEAEAAVIAERTIARMTAALAEFGDLTRGGVTAGIAEWEPGQAPTQLIARADQALLHGKQHGLRGTPHAYSVVPEPAPGGRFDRGIAAEPRAAGPAPVPQWPDGSSADQRLRVRTRQLAVANALGARLSAMTDVDAIADAVVDEMHRAFGYYCCAVLRIRTDGHVESAAGAGDAFLALGDRRWSQRTDEGLVGRCLSSRRSVLSGNVDSEPDYRGTPETCDVHSEMVVPLMVAGELWGALNVEEIEPGAFDADDLRLLETVADQVGAALRSASLYEQLERGYLGTAEALAAALEAKDSYTAHHARSIVERAEAVGRRMGMGEAELRDLRFGAAFHDIGKIAVPEAILNKCGPLTAEERAEVERHTIVGEQILAPVEFLAGARRLVRHEHERWDGLGYPDALAGEAIPLGARIIFACDALHAMTSDRPYRKAMSMERAVAELRANAGTQFDALVVEALLQELRGA